jgi:hypothetical protein
MLDIVHTVPYRTKRQLFCRRVCSCVRRSVNLNALTPSFPWCKNRACVHSAARLLFSVIELLGSSLFSNQFPDVSTASYRPTSACTLWTVFTLLELAGSYLIWPFLPVSQDLRFLATDTTTATINIFFFPHRFPLYDKVSSSQVLQMYTQTDGNDIRPHTARIYNECTSTDLSLVTA